MKKLLLTLALAVVATASAFAQIGVTAGYANSVATYHYGSSSTKEPAMNGGFIEAFYQLPLTDNLFIEPALRYTLLTSTQSATALGATFTGTRTEHYIGVPVMAHLQYELANAVKVFLFAGPTFEYGVSGTQKSGVGSISGTSNVFDEYYSPLDMLIGGGVGAEFKNLRLSAGYHYGFLDRDGKDTDVTLRDSQILIGLSLLF